MLEGLVSFDQDITLAINSVHSTLSDSLWIFMSEKLVWAPFYLLALFLLAKKMGWKKTVIATLCIILTIVATDQIGNIVKHSVGRLRPCHDDYMLERGLRLLERPGGLYGFYSAHAADSFGFAVCATCCLFTMDKVRSNRRYAAIALFWAFMVSLSRVFVGKHYLGDVVVGAMVGCIIGLAMGQIAAYISKRFA